ncbi:MAG: CDP-glycerol glycerophosphotransferase family protein [Candidatus Marinimicrobia bacterium]|nr:CDP-glycerol glycerophosphotransferase family protein [Candidatus Neomarinimicrobiota bacterium]
MTGNAEAVSETGISQRSLYFLANQVYQFSYAKPIYERTGGIFIVPKLKKLLRFKFRLRNTNAFPDVKTFLNTPKLLYRDIKSLQDFHGVIISQSATRIIREKGKSITIFMGHGTGDKKYGGSVQTLESYDYHFISGPKHEEKLRDVGLNLPEKHLIRIGNPRFDAYIKGEVDRESCLDFLGIVDRQRPSILYAPSWSSNHTNLLKFVFRFCRELTRDYNLIVRPHHFEMKYLPLIRTWVKAKGIKHVYFSNPNNLLHEDTFSVFACSDLMISDVSSILYEYLITRQPVIITQNDFDNLHAMPDEMNVASVADQYDGSPGMDIARMVADNLARSNNRDRYQALLENCFYFNDGHSTDRAVEFLSAFT